MAVQQTSKYRISRRGRKLQISDDQRTLVALPKDVPERTWAEILQKEENDLLVFDIREEILEEALRIGYEKYMERQTVIFTAHVAAQAWLKLIDWHFYRHDPGEDPSAYPPCFIPKRVESWVPDELPDPSPKDTWCRQELEVIEDTPDESLQRWPSSSSLDLPLVEEISSEFWFPGKVWVPEELRVTDEKLERTVSYDSSGSAASSSEDQLVAESEVLQKITDYSTEDLSPKESTLSALKRTSGADAWLRGAGDGAAPGARRRLADRSKLLSRASVRGAARAGGAAPAGARRSSSRLSVISDCRLRNLRLDTQYEVTSQKVDTPPGEAVKRK